MSLMSLTAVELGRKIKEKEVTVEEAVTAALDAIEKREAQVHSFVTVDREGALKRAKEVQAKIDAGELTGPLAGVPVAIKDNMCTKGLLTTCSSKILENYIPTYTATAIENLINAKVYSSKKSLEDDIKDGNLQLHAEAQYIDISKCIHAPLPRNHFDLTRNTMKIVHQLSPIA